MTSTDDDVGDLVVEASTTIKQAMNRIDRTGAGIVFVAEDGQLVGTATDGDIRRGILSGIELAAPITEVVAGDPVTLRQDWSAARIADHLAGVPVDEIVPDHRMLIVPVIDENDQVVAATFVSREGEVVRTLSGTVDTDVDGERTSTDGQTANGVSAVLVVGGAGYIGSVLSRRLLDAGYRVRVLDNLTYGDRGISDLYDHDRFEFVEGDMRSIETVVEAIQGMDAVVYLGAIVGDPASAIDPRRTLEVNYHAVRLAASICKYHQVNRFVFASTCSVYGESDSPQDRLTEQSPLNPVSLYAKSKIESERAILDMEDENFSPTVFRMATIYGLSPRMRFDLVVNILSAKAYTEGTVPIFGGDQYRPLVHVADASRAYIDCLHAPIDRVSGEVYNVGSDEQNYRILEVGEIVASCFPDAEIDRQPQQEDERTYQVSFSKIRDELGFEPEWTIPDCCEEIEAAFEEGRFEDFTAAKYNNYRSLQNDNPFLGTGETDVAESQAE